MTSAKIVLLKVHQTVDKNLLTQGNLHLNLLSENIVKMIGELIFTLKTQADYSCVNLMGKQYLKHKDLIVDKLRLESILIGLLQYQIRRSFVGDIITIKASSYPVVNQPSKATLIFELFDNCESLSQEDLENIFKQNFNAFSDN